MTGRVVSAMDRRPVAGARVTLSSARPLRGGGRLASMEAGADGRFVSPGLAPGAYRLWFEAPGRPKQRQDLRLIAGAESALGDIALEDWTGLSLRVVDGDGKPAAGLQVFDARFDTVDSAIGRALFTRPRVSRTDARGAMLVVRAFAFSDLPRGLRAHIPRRGRAPRSSRAGRAAVRREPCAGLCAALKKARALFFFGFGIYASEHGRRTITIKARGFSLPRLHPHHRLHHGCRRTASSPDRPRRRRSGDQACRPP